MLRKPALWPYTGRDRGGKTVRHPSPLPHIDRGFRLLVCTVIPACLCIVRRQANPRSSFRPACASYADRQTPDRHSGEGRNPVRQWLYTNPTTRGEVKGEARACPVQSYCVMYFTGPAPCNLVLFCISRGLPCEIFFCSALHRVK